MVFDTLHLGRNYTLIYEQRVNNGYPSGLGFTINLTVTGGEAEGTGGGEGEGDGNSTGDGEGVSDNTETNTGVGNNTNDTTDGEGVASEGAGGDDQSSNAEAGDEQSVPEETATQDDKGVKNPSLEPRVSDVSQQDVPAPSVGDGARDGRRLGEQSAQGTETERGSGSDTTTLVAGAAQAGGTPTGGSPSGGLPSGGTPADSLSASGLPATATSSTDTASLADGVTAYRLITDKTVPVVEKPIQQETIADSELVLAGVPLAWLILMGALALALPLGACQRRLSHHLALHLPSRLRP
jgi:hypothetical protein